MRLTDLKIIVTGGGSGMGRVFALELARAGAAVAIADVSEGALAAVVAEAAGLPGQVHAFRCNVADEADVVAMVGGAAAAMGGLNGLINNAGIFRDGLLVKRDKATGAIERMSLARWNDVIGVDLTGPFLCTRELAAWCLGHDAGPAVVVNISSIARHGNQGQSNYSAAKAGLVADTKLWAEELARYRIRVGAVAPGFVDTPILRGMRPEVLEKSLARVPLGRAAAPEEIFQAVRFVIECDYFTGRCIDVDGGMVL